MIRLLASLCLASAAALSASAQTVTPPPATPAHAAAELPPGAGKAILQRSCAACHGLEVVTSKRATPEDWSATVQLMVSRGAEASDDEVDTLVKYLSTNFPDKPAAPAAAPSAAPTAAPSAAPSSRLAAPGAVDPRFMTQLASSKKTDRS